MVTAYAFDQDRIRVGRDPQSDVVLPSPDVSRLHCRLERQENGVEVHLVDSGSSNGTRVNGARVDRRHLESGDAIQIADYQLWIQLLDSHKASLIAQAEDNCNAPTLPRP